MSVALIKTFENLPYIPRKIFVEQLDILEVITLSLMSPSIKNATRNLGLPVSEFKWIIRAPGHFVIHITPKDQPRITFKLAQESTLELSKGYLNSQKVEIARNQRAFTVKCVGEKIQTFDNLTRHLLEMLNVEKFYFNTNLYTDFVFKYTRKFDSFSLSHQKLTLSQSRALFEDIIVGVFKLEYVQVGEPDQQYKVALNHCDISIQYADWLSFQSILDMKCQKLNINCGTSAGVVPRKPLWKHSDFTLFVRNWLNGELENLKEFNTYFESKTSEKPLYLPYLKLKEQVELMNQGGVNIENQVQRPDGKTSEFRLLFDNFEFKIIE